MAERSKSEMEIEALIRKSLPDIDAWEGGLKVLTEAILQIELTPFSGKELAALAELLAARWR